MISDRASRSAGNAGDELAHRRRLPGESEIRKLSALPSASHHGIRQRARRESGERRNYQQSSERLHQPRKNELPQNHQQNEHADANQQAQPYPDRTWQDSFAPERSSRMHLPPQQDDH